MKRIVKKSVKMPERETLTEAYEVRAFRDESEEPKVMEGLSPKYSTRSRARSRPSRRMSRDMASRQFCPMTASSETTTSAMLMHRSKG